MKIIIQRAFEFSFTAAVIALAWASPTARGVPVAINDPNFATPALTVGTFTSGFPSSSWVGSAGSNTGVFNADGSTYYTFNPSYPAPGYVPDGMNVGYIRQTGDITQDLTSTEGDTWTANSTYTLTGEIGSRLDDPIETGSSAYVEILESNGSPTPTVLAQESLPAPTTGTFNAWTISYNTPAVAPTGDILIELGYTAIDDDQVNYTGISLTDVPIGVPEGGVTALFFGFGLLGLAALRRTVLLRPAVCRA